MGGWLGGAVFTTGVAAGFGGIYASHMRSEGSNILSAIDEALRAYRRLQIRSLHLLEPDGILVTCCCSGLITQDMLTNLLAQLAADEQRDIQILERRGQGQDHPVSASCLESDYLKCLICRVA